MELLSVNASSTSIEPTDSFSHSDFANSPFGLVIEYGMVPFMVFGIVGNVMVFLTARYMVQTKKKAGEEKLQISRIQSLSRQFFVNSVGMPTKTFKNSKNRAHNDQKSKRNCRFSRTHVMNINFSLLKSVEEHSSFE